MGYEQLHFTNEKNKPLEQVNNSLARKLQSPNLKNEKAKTENVFQRS